MSALNNAQFDGATNVSERDKRRKLRRKGLLGTYVGLGNLWMSYPYMYGTMGTGGLSTVHEAGENREQEIAEHDAGTDTGETTGLTSGMSEGGTSFGVTGYGGGGL